MIHPSPMSGRAGGSAAAHRATPSPARRLRFLATAAAAALALVAPVASAPWTGEHAQAASSTTVTLSPSETTYVNQQRPGSAHNGRGYAFATKSVNRAFLKFDTAALKGRKVLSAKLQVRTTVNKAPKAALEVHPTATDWKATTLTVKNRPAYRSTVLNQIVTTKVGQTATIPLTTTSTIATGGPTAFELRYNYPNSEYQLSTRGTTTPKLVLTLAAAATTTADSARATAASAPSTSASGGSGGQATPTTSGSTGGSAAGDGNTASDGKTPATGSGAQTPDAGKLPFTMPAGAKTGASSKMVFAHYFTPYPISLDNKDAASDYYTKNYLTPTGESSKHAAYGGLLRDRPLPRSPLSGDWQTIDMQTEVRQASAAGLDGFAIDVLNLSGTHWDRTQRMMRAANSVDKKFRIMPELDMSAMRDKPQAEFVPAIKTLADQPSAYRLSDGRLVLSAFFAEKRPASWWKDLFAQVKSRYGISIAFVPTLLNYSANANSFAPISYGLGNWGDADLNTSLKSGGSARSAHALGKKWMQPILPQNVRPNQGTYDEAGNSETLRSGWTHAIDDKAELVQMVTWNDYSEGTQVAPSAAHGWVWLDISSYYLAKYKTGSFPTVTKDAVYVSHRNQFTTSTPQYKSSKKMTQRSRGGTETKARDTVGITTFLRAPGKVTVTVGSRTQTFDAPAGMSFRTVPLATGTVSASVTRSGATVAAVKSPVTVSNSPKVQDLQYFAAGSLRGTQGQKQP